jgi:NHL repeat
MRAWSNALAVALAGSLCWPALAVAVQFGSDGRGAGQFIEPFGIAVQRTTGDVYVLDSNNHRVERFSKDGAFELAWGWGVTDGRTPALQVCRRTCFPGLAGAGPGAMSFAEDVAVDNDPHSPSYEDVYIADIGNHRIEKYSSTGRFLAAYGRGVNLTARAAHDRAREDRCPVKPNDRCGAGKPGSGPGEFEFPVEGHLLAVGGDGSLYVGDRDRVEKLRPNGAFAAQIPLVPTPAKAEGEGGGVSGLAVDSHGDLYAIRNGIAGVRDYGPTGQPIRVFDDKGEPAYAEGPTPVVALDGHGHVFVDEFVKGRHRIREYDQRGRELASFDERREDVLHGMTYNPVNGQLYVLNTNGDVNPPRFVARTIAPPTIYLDLGALAALLSW